MEHLSLCVYCKLYHKLCIVWGDFVDSGGDQLGQASGSTDGAQIQTLRDLKEDLSNCNCFMAIAGWLYSIALLESHIHHLVKLCIYITVPSLIDCLFCEIFYVLRHQQIHVQNQIHQGQSSDANLLNMARYRKAVSSALWVQLALVICYLPINVVNAFVIKGSYPSVVIAKEYAGTLVYLNSTLNPILYCWKMNEVRQAVKGIIGEFGCLLCPRCLVW